nr:hypothetical protein [Serratia marcescens]
MFSIIYHAGAAVLFLVMSLAAGAGRSCFMAMNIRQVISGT